MLSLPGILVQFEQISLISETNLIWELWVEIKEETMISWAGNENTCTQKRISKSSLNPSMTLAKRSIQIGGPNDKSHCQNIAHNNVWFLKRDFTGQENKLLNYELWGHARVHSQGIQLDVGDYQPIYILIFWMYILMRTQTEQ